jgi:hypothetical protein
VRYQYRYTKDEKRHLAAANRVLDDPAAPPREVNRALQHIRKIQDAAERRAKAATSPPAPPEPETVDDLVAALENAQKQPFQPLENKGSENAPNAREAILAPPEPAKALEVTQTAPELKTAPTAFCGFCSAAGRWNTVSGGVILCPTCFGKVCAADMRAASAASLARQSSWLYEKGTDPNTNDLADLRGMGRDYQNSVQLWQEQAREDADRQAQEAAERAAAEDRYHASRARWIQDGGRL